MSEEFSSLLVDALPKIRRFSRSLTGDAADADDLTQETVAVALNRQRQWTPGTRFDSWVYKIAQNLHISELRRTTVRQRHRQSLNGSQTWVQGGAEANSDLVNVVNFIRSLPAEQQTVIVLVAVEGHSYAETAELLGIPVGTVTSRLSRARTAIKGFRNG
ncbi:RNA polymerase sigma factor [Leisingera sp. D0M16]|uniref:RNA polymerase sigma factor n=1 Tax=Leisingera coralii TaxID=3351347 RepID=UPI003B807CD8